MTLRIRRLAILGIVLATIGCDRATKRLASDHLAGRGAQRFLADTVRLQYVENRGAFLGLGAGLPDWARGGLFVFGTGLLLAGVVALGLRHRVRGAGLVGLALLWAGGLSNLIDRLLRGSVVDFLNLGLGPLRTGIFNVADVAIMAGCALMIAARAGAVRRPQP